MSYIEVRDLTKIFTIKMKREKGRLFREKRTVEALKDISFSVEKGEMIGCIGPNGAGKSTTVKVLSGILVPESGSVEVGGRIPWKERKEHVKEIGVVFGQRMQLWWDVPIIDSFTLLKDIYSIPEQDYHSRLRELTEKLDLAELLPRPLRQLSLGQRMRCELAGSLLHRPQLLFLDEPTIGLDAVSKLALRDFLKSENEEHGTTIFLTTHDMDDISALCRRVLVMGHGRKLFDGDFSKLIETYDTRRTVRVRTDETDIPGLPECCSCQNIGGELLITFRKKEVPTIAVIEKVQKHIKADEMTVEPQNIDEMIAEMFREYSL